MSPLDPNCRPSRRPAKRLLFLWYGALVFITIWALRFMFAASLDPASSCSITTATSDFSTPSLSACHKNDAYLINTDGLEENSHAARGSAKAEGDAAPEPRGWPATESPTADSTIDKLAMDYGDGYQAQNAAEISNETLSEQYVSAGAEGCVFCEEIPTLTALRWLRRHQQTDGAWSISHFDRNCDRTRTAVCDGAGSEGAGDVGATSLAVLAFLGAGYTHEDGAEFADCIRNALQYLRHQQQADGLFGRRSDGAATAYNHALATFAMTEAYGLTGQEFYKSYAQRGVRLIVDWQNWRPDGSGEKYGWRYSPRDRDNDTSVTIWMLMALKSARACEIFVPDEACAGALHWFDDVTDDLYYRAGYHTLGDNIPSPDPAKPNAMHETTTAMAMLGRIFAGQRPTLAPIKAGADLLLQDLPVWNAAAGSIDYYYWYFGTTAAFQVGGETWNDWNKALKSALVEHQNCDKTSCQYGSWDPAVDCNGRRFGRVCATALNCLTLQIYYRYDKAFK